MTIFVLGINHKTAAIPLRERFYFAPEKLACYLQDLLCQGWAQEAVLLSTCNRSELYCETDNIPAMYDWFCAQGRLTYAECCENLYCYEDEEAVSHMMRVACGVDSMVIGEAQIFGQMKEAFSESCSIGAVGTLFHRLFQQIFSVAKMIRTTTAIGACPVSVASAALHFAKNQLDAFQQAKVLLLGAGDIVSLLIKYLQPTLHHPLTLVNRSIEKAAALSAGAQTKIYGLNQLSQALHEADLVISATGSAHPVVTHQLVEACMRNRADREMIMIDIAMPRDIEPSVNDISGISLYGMDDLKTFIEKNQQGREHASHQALNLIAKRSADFMQEIRGLEAVTQAICVYRGQVETICHAELLKAKQQLDQGIDPSQVLDRFARAFTQKMLHTPSVQMRQAGAEGRFELLAFAKQLFAHVS